MHEKRLAIESGLCKAGVWERGTTEIYGSGKAEIVEIDFLYFEKNISLLFTYLS